MSNETIDLMCAKHECLRRAMEAGSHSIKLLVDSKVSADGLITELKETVSKANSKLKQELEEM